MDDNGMMDLDIGMSTGSDEQLSSSEIDEILGTEYTTPGAEDAITLENDEQAAPASNLAKLKKKKALQRKKEQQRQQEIRRQQELRNQEEIYAAEQRYLSEQTAYEAYQKQDNNQEYREESPVLSRERMSVEEGAAEKEVNSFESYDNRNDTFNYDESFTEKDTFSYSESNDQEPINYPENDYSQLAQETNTPVNNPVEPDFAGSITEDAYWVGCDIIQDEVTERTPVYNSYLDEDIKQRDPLPAAEDNYYSANIEKYVENPTDKTSSIDPYKQYEEVPSPWQQENTSTYSSTMENTPSYQEERQYDTHKEETYKEDARKDNVYKEPYQEESHREENIHEDINKEEIHNSTKETSTENQNSRQTEETYSEKRENSSEIDNSSEKKEDNKQSENHQEKQPREKQSQKEQPQERQNVDHSSQEKQNNQTNNKIPDNNYNDQKQHRSAHSTPAQESGDNTHRNSHTAKGNTASDNENIGGKEANGKSTASNLDNPNRKVENSITKSKQGPVDTQTAETEEKSGRELQEAAQRKFKREGGKLWKDFCQTSSVIISTAVHDVISQDESGTVETIQKGKNIAHNVLDFAAFFGASDAFDMVLNKDLKDAKITKDISDLISDGKISLADLGDPKLAEKLEELGFSSDKIGHIMDNACMAKDILVAKETLLKFSTDTGKLNDNLVNFLNSPDFLQTGLFSDEFTKAAQIYFANHKDELLRKMNPATMTEKELKKLLKDKKINLSAEDRHLINVLYKNTKNANIKHKSKHAHGFKGKLSAGFNIIKNQVMKISDPAIDGIRTIGQTFNGIRTGLSIARFTGKVGTVGAKFAGRVVFLNPASRFVGGQIKKGAKIVGSTFKRKIYSTKTVKQIVQTKNYVVKAVNNNKIVKKAKAGVKKVKKVVGNIKRKVRNINNAKKAAGRTIRSGAAKVGRVVRAPMVVFKPIAWVGKVVNAISDFLKKKILIPIAGAIGVLILFLFIMSAISGLMMSIINVEKKVVTLEEEDMQRLVDELNASTQTIYDSALVKAKAAPPDGTTVYDGVRLYAYGSPRSENDETSEWYHHSGQTIDKSKLNGWHVYYLDSEGNVIGNNVNNTKDIICLAAAMMDNSTDNLQVYRHICNDIYQGMRPVVTTQVSDIYHTIYSTDQYPFDGSQYYCNDANFYSNYNASKDGGVCFYEFPATEHSEPANDAGYICTGSGCEYTEWDEWVLTCTEDEHTHGSGCDSRDCSHTHDLSCLMGCTHSHDDSCCSKSEHTHSREAGCYRHDFHRDYYCPGHDALHCSYGYQDINVYVTLLQKDDMYKADTDEDKSIFTFKVPTNYECTEFETRTSTANYYIYFPDGYKTKMKYFNECGFWDYDNHIRYASLSTDYGDLSCDIERLEGSEIVHGTDTDEKCNGSIEQCNTFFNLDWFETYGVQVYTVDSGLSVGGTLSAEELAALQEKITNQFGSIDAARSSLVNFALDKVGAIKYWWGGKPSSKGWDAKWGTTAPSSDSYYSSNVARGRTVYGLDCSGFVGWCYWNTFDTQPGLSTASFTTSLGLPQISFRDLQPGDIGLENRPGSTTNHIGIFVGYDENGKALWVHCNGSTGNVAVNNTNCFRLYYNLLP